MAKKITGVVKLQIPAGAAKPGPPVGPALGAAGVNIKQFVDQFNERTKGGGGMLPSLPSSRWLLGFISRRSRHRALRPRIA